MTDQLLATDIPQDIEAEQAILGAIIYNNDVLAETASILSPKSFFSIAHQRIFRAMLELGDQNIPIDEITLGDELKSLRQLDEIGGYSYLAELIDCVPSSGNIQQYSKIVQEHSLLRDLIETSSEIARKSRSPEKNISELLAEAENKIAEISLRSTEKGYHSIKSILSSNLQRLEQISETADEITGIGTGFIDLDKITSGLQPSDLIIVAARPSMGKTAFALNIATFVATPTKHRAEIQKEEEKGAILMFSLEMSKEQLVMRMLASEAKVDSQKLKSGNLEQDDWNKLAMATESLSTAPIFINDTSSLSPYELVSITKQLHKEYKNGVSMVIVDYLQLMKLNRANVPREQEIAEISRSLKGIAKELNIPVVALSQLNRSLESRSEKRPLLSDLRESGAIEQDADIILFIYRDEIYNENTNDRGKAEIIIAKHRNGPTGKIELAFIGKYTRFASLSKLESHE
ncbi:MAG: replicative DNA helicase [Deltaproteobacteria bacterium]|nr:replicative DNA helicase [Deltaproteobacteria bacterium]